MKYPEIKDFEVTFGSYPREWFDETLKKEFKTPENKRKYEEIVSTLFFSGGNIPYTASDDRVKPALRLFKSIIGSFEPKHEHKIHVCALILEDLNS